MQTRLFFQDDMKYFCIKPEKFAKAIQKGDSRAIEVMLAAKQNGIELDINALIAGKAPLEILLERKDFKNAKQLLQAGAATSIGVKTWVNDEDGPYPYGYYNGTRRDIFKEFANDRETLIFLLHETANRENSNKEAVRASDWKVSTR